MFLYVYITACFTDGFSNTSILQAKCTPSATHQTLTQSKIKRLHLCTYE